jgi:hypothetical protein
MKRIFLALAALFALSSAFAQTKFPLTIVCNEMGADVYINNNLYTKTMPNLVIQLPPAVYSITIAKPGFNEFNQSVTVRARGTVLNVILQPLQAPAMVPPPNTLLPMFPLNISSNVAGAQVYLNGKLSGQTPFGLRVVGGTYEIRVTAPGYADFQQRMNVRSPTQINAMLQGMSSQLSISSNVNGAEVIINGNPAGRTPFMGQMPMGSYSVRVRAPGYIDFQQDLVIGNGPAQINAILQGATASWQLNMPESLVNKGNGRDQGQHRNVQFWVDGALQNGFAGQLMPGRHVLRFISGELAVETQVDIQAGRAYVFEPFLGLNIK